MRTLFLTLITCLLVLPAHAKYSGGTGEPNDPYQIGTAADLILLGSSQEDHDKHFILTADIDLDPNLPGRKVFDKAVIPFFLGVFDGNGHTISHLTIKGKENLGLFGHLVPLFADVEVRDLGVVDINIIGSDNNIGGLVGHNGLSDSLGFGSTVTHCYSTGSVSGKENVGGLMGDSWSWGSITSSYSTATVSATGRWPSSAGGLVGSNGGTVTQCYSTGLVSGNSSVGGLVGVNYSRITTSYSSGAVTGGSRVGGLVGWNAYGTATHCYSTGSVTGNDSVGGLVGSNGWMGPGGDGPIGYVHDCFSVGAVNGTGRAVGGLVGGDSPDTVTHSVWDMETSGLLGSAGGVGLTTAEMMDPNMLALNGFANDPNWVLDAGRDYPRLAWEGTRGAIIPEPKIDWLEGQGTAEDPYRVDTADQLILLGKASILWDKNFVLGADIDLNPVLPNRRVFGQAPIQVFTGVFDGKGHTISNLTIKGSGYLGFFGQLGSWWAAGTEVRDLGIVGVNITGSGNRVGGLVGQMVNICRVTRCYSTGAVSGSGEVGGLVGLNWHGYVGQCYSTGAVSAISWYVGGLVGDNWGHVTECYSTCVVDGNGCVGGLVGYNDEGTMTQCYATGAVSGDWAVGGLVGANDGSVTHCYSTGAVSGRSDVGGLVGSGWASHVCFWDIETSGQSRSAGGIGKTTAEMKNIQTYLNEGWDFVGEIVNGTHETWQMPEEGGYPVLATLSGYTPPELQGLGTVENPYLICDALDLGAMIHYSPDAYYRLAASIDLSGVHWSVAVIPSFEGSFDGNNLTISHLTITGSDYMGLFGRLASGAEVKGIGVVDVNITGSGDHVGGLVGSSHGFVTQCYSTGVVRGHWRVGALVGESYGAVIQCYSTGTVSGGLEVGGLVGSHMRGTVTKCYSSGAVSGKSDVGGLVGDNSGSVIQCYSSGAVSGDWQVGGLVGSGDITNVMHAVWDTQTSGLSKSAGGIGLTTAEMTHPYMLGLNGFANDPNWVLDAGRDYPRLAWQGTPGGIIPEPIIDWLEGQGTPEDPYQISAADQLILLTRTSALWDKHFVLGADINLDPNLPGRKAFAQAVIPVFRGVFDGNGNVISRMTIRGASYLGLFGRLEPGAKVKDLGVADVNVIGSGSHVGALVGRSYGTVIQCYSTGTVSGRFEVGGLVGSHVRGTVTQCYSTASVSASIWDGGGLVGYNYGSIITSYSTGTVSGPGSSVGGLVGRGSIDHVTASFWDTQTSRKTRSDGGTGKTTAEMQTAKTFLDAGWDFVGETANGMEDIWWILEGKDYPRLLWEADNN